MQFRFTAAVAATLMLLAPALWNGFPLLQYDTGGYLARWYEGYLEQSRSTVYGLYLVLTARPDFWPAVTVQALADGLGAVADAARAWRWRRRWCCWSRPRRCRS